MLNSAETSEAPDSAETPQNSVFIIKDIRPICRARTLRLQNDDAIVAVNGKPFEGDVYDTQAVMGYLVGGWPQPGGGGGGWNL